MPTLIIIISDFIKYR